MSETIFKILLSELNVVRIICRNPQCGAILELPLTELSRLLDKCQCKYCETTFRVGNADCFTTLAQAIRGLNSIKEKVGVEFVLPVKPEPK
jgi:hypothetical protein